MLVGALPEGLSVKVLIKLKLNSYQPIIFNYDKCLTCGFQHCRMTDVLTLLDEKGVYMALGVSPDSIPAGGTFQQILVVVNFPAICRQQTPTQQKPTD